MLTLTTQPPALGRCQYCDAGRPRILEQEWNASSNRYDAKYVHLRAEQGAGFVDCAIQDAIARNPRTGR